MQVPSGEAPKDLILREPTPITREFAGNAPDAGSDPVQRTSHPGRADVLGDVRVNLRRLHVGMPQ